MKANLKNLFLILAVAVPFLFVSCDGTEDDAAEITIKFNSNGVFASGDAVAGTITSVDEALTKVVILKDNNAVKTITSFNALPILKGTDGVYTISITDLADGSYTMRAESKTGETSKDFTIGSATPEITYTVESISVEAGKTYGYKQGESVGTFKVTKAKAGEVEVEIGDKKVVLLSDAGNSYMMTSFAGADFATAKANTSNILFCLLAKSTTIASATKATSEDIKTGAVKTLFTATAID